MDEPNANGKERGRKTWNKCMMVDTKKVGFIREDALIRDTWKSLTSGNRPTLPQGGKEAVVLYELSSY